jgi:hypothetical protein
MEIRIPLNPRKMGAFALGVWSTLITIFLTMYFMPTPWIFFIMWLMDLRGKRVF